jgi:hypothetical protein
MKPWRDKNSGVHPADPDFDNSYDPEDDFNRYMDEVDLREMMREGN